MNQLKAGVILTYLTFGLRTIITLLYTPIMLRLMGQSEYGLYSLAASVIAYLSILDLGFGNAIVRYTAKFRAEGKQEEQYNMFGMFILFFSIISIVILIAGYFLCNNTHLIFNATMTGEEVRKTQILLAVMVGNLALSFPFGVFGAIITAYERFIFIRIIALIKTILNPIVMLAMLYAGYRSIGMVIIATIFNIITITINLYYCFKILNIKITFKHFEWGFFKEVAIYSFWIFLNAIMDRIYWSTGQFVLGIYKGAVAVSIYAIAIQFQNMYMSFSTAISGVFLPKVTSISTKENSSSQLSDLFIRVGRLQYIIMAFILSGFTVFGHQFIIAWAGSEYSDSYYMTLLFFISLLIPLIQNMGINILQACNRMRFRSISYVIIAFASLGLSIPLTKLYGGIGCAVAISLALFIGQGVIMNIYYWKRVKINIPLFWKEIIKMSFTPVCFSLTGFFLFRNTDFNLGSLLFNITVFTLLYITSCWFVDMNHFEKELVAAPILKIRSKIHDRYKK